MSITSETRAWVEVDLDALRENLETVRRTVGRDTALIPMVKANGYGLGAERVAHALERLEPWAYGVATAEEGAALRRAEFRPRPSFSARSRRNPTRWQPSWG